MPRIQPLSPAAAEGKAKQLLDGVQAKLGFVPNMMATMANSPAAFEAYLNFSGALAKGTLDAKLREEIALTVGQANACEYCLSAHSALGQMAGLDAATIKASRQARSTDEKRAAALRFAQAIVFYRGLVSDDALAAVRAAGWSDAEITDIIATVALNIFTNYFNHIAQTTIDFPVVRAAEVA